MWKTTVDNKRWVMTESARFSWLPPCAIPNPCLFCFPCLTALCFLVPDFAWILPELLHLISSSIACGSFMTNHYRILSWVKKKSFTSLRQVKNTLEKAVVTLFHWRFTAMCKQLVIRLQVRGSRTCENLLAHIGPLDQILEVIINQNDSACRIRILHWMSCLFF